MPESGKQSVVRTDNAKTKVILFSFAAGGGLTEDVAPLDATIQILLGTAMLTIRDEFQPLNFTESVRSMNPAPSVSLRIFIQKVILKTLFPTT